MLHLRKEKHQILYKVLLALSNTVLSYAADPAIIEIREMG